MSEGDDLDLKTPRLAETAAPAVRPLAEILERLPQTPGVYLMKDRRGKIIYIGKAQSLRTRVRQYFQPATGDTRDFVPLLDKIVGDIETLVTTNEKEALLLENTLIKKHQPRFNVKLRDDKNYLVLRLDPSAQWPRLEVVRKFKDDHAYHFGPYHSATSARETLRVVNRHFQLRTCTDHVLQTRRRPCLQFQIKRCPAPCVLPVSRDEYGEQVRDVRLFLEAKSDELLDRLQGRMKDASGKLEFERAATVRDQIRALESSLESQRVVSADLLDQDVVGFHREGLALEIVMMAIRQGKVAGSRAFSFGDQEFPDAEILSSFLGLYYDLSPQPPDEVLLPFAIADAELKADWLTDLKASPRGKKVEVLVPQRGPRRALLELAMKNARASFVSRRSADEDADATLAKLQKRLRLPRLPRVIECYDISHIQGSDTVASMVVFVNGRPDKARYRTYKLRHGGVGEPDDFASMYEVLTRRLRRGLEAEKAALASATADNDTARSDPWRLPDLIVIDGGKGQLGSVLAAARDLGVDVRPGSGLPFVALAKERDFETALAPAVEAKRAGGERGGGQRGDKERRPDRVFLPNAKDPIAIRPNSAEMFVLAQLRDEAHRFALGFHRSQRKRRTLRSAIADVAGIGPSRQRALLQHFGSVRKIRDASVEDLASVQGMTRAAAEAVAAYFAAGGAAADARAAAADARLGPPAGSPGALAVTPSAEEVEEEALESQFAAVEAQVENDHGENDQVENEDD